MAATRAALLDAAAVVFARQGYEGASVKDIAEHAGHTTGALYAHFATKAELFLTLLTERYAAKAGELDALFGDRDLDESLEALDERFHALREIEGDWDLLATEFWLYAVRHPEARRPLIDRHARLRGDIAQLIARTLAAHGISSALPTETIATAVIALGDGLGIVGRLDPSAVPPRLFRTAVVHLVLGLATDTST